MYIYFINILVFTNYPAVKGEHPSKVLHYRFGECLRTDAKSMQSGAVLLGVGCILK